MKKCRLSKRQDGLSVDFLGFAVCVYVCVSVCVCVCMCVHACVCVCVTLIHHPHVCVYQELQVVVYTEILVCSSQ